jgi:hypothetical protein
MFSKPPKLRRQTLSEEYYYGYNPDAEFGSIGQTTNASTLGLSIPSSASGLPVGDRRKTIETCENIFLHTEESSKLRARTPPSNPHRILLHRDKNDTSIRTNGLGMRIVGGQECEDGGLGSYNLKFFFYFIKIKIYFFFFHRMFCNKYFTWWSS